jgi:AraC-like DNA-binding protein
MFSARAIEWLKGNFSRPLRIDDLAERLDDANAAFHESPSQFSREYSRLFGAPPPRDISRLRQQAAQ